MISRVCYSTVLVATTAFVFALPSTEVGAQADGEGAADGQLTGLEIAKRSDKASNAATESQTMTMTLENSRGQTRVRTITGWSKEIDDETEHRFSRFLEPSDVKDTTLLSYDYDQADDDTWLYLPALKKVKRILSSNKTDYFMGSDFTYEDMENIDLVNWDYTLQGKETVDGVECYKVEAVPNNDEKREETGYSKTVAWYGVEDFVVRKAEYHDKKDRLAKRLTAEDIKPTTPDDPRPRAHKMTMENFITKHKTVLDIRDLKLDIEVDPDIFSQRNMRQ